MHSINKFVATPSDGKDSNWQKKLVKLSTNAEWAGDIGQRLSCQHLNIWARLVRIWFISHLEACLTVSSVHPENELKNKTKLESFRSCSDLQCRSDQVQYTQWYIVGPADFPCHDEIVLKCEKYKKK